MPGKDSRSDGKKQGGWRNKPGSSVRGGRRSGQEGAGWTKRKDRTQQRSVMRHRVKLAAGVLVAAGLVVGFLVYLMHKPMRTPLLAVVVTEYDAPIPPNAWAVEDVERLAELDDEEILKYVRCRWESKEQGLRQLRKQLDAMQPGGPGKDVVVVYLSMHGVLDGDSRPCLLPPGASRSDSRQWLPLAELIDHLFVAEGERTLPDETKKLLVLDANRMDANWDLGLLVNGFADRLPAVLTDAKVPNLTILNSAGSGQIGWAAPELGGSVFGYFFWQGLKGAADAEGTGNADTIVSLGELHAYLKAHVGQWVTENRFDRQEPLLVAGDEDWELVYAQSSEQTAIPEAPEADTGRWEEVARLWDRHHQLKQRIPYRHDPLGWEEFQHGLLRLEQLVAAGKAYDDRFDDSRKELENLADRLAADPLPPGLAAYSLPLASGLHGTDQTPQQRKALAEYLQGATGGPAVRRGWFFDTTIEPSDADAPKDYAYLPAAGAAWDVVHRRANAELLAEALQLVGKADGLPEADVVEVHFLRMLLRYLDGAVWQRGTDAVHRALKARHLAEVAAAPSDYRIGYWVQHLVDQGDAARRRADDRLFVGGHEELIEATRWWNEAANETAGVEGKYVLARALAGEVAESLQTRDRAWAEIPHYARWLLARTGAADPALLEDLRQVAENNDALAEKLDTALQRRQWTPQRWVDEKFPEAHQAVAEPLERLQKAYADACDHLQAEAGLDHQTLQAMERVLAVPLLTGADRRNLRKKYLQIVDQQQGDQGGIQKTTGGEQAVADPQFLRRARTWQEHPALAMLAYAKRTIDKADGDAIGEVDRVPWKKVPDGEPVDVALGHLSRQGEEIRRRLAAVRPHSDRLVDLATKQMEAESGNSVSARTELQDSARLVRTSAALLGQPLWRERTDDPVHRLRCFDLHHLMLWHCRRTLDDFWGPDPDRTSVPYFETVAGHYLESAKELCPEAATLSYGGEDLAQLLAARSAVAETGIRPSAGDLFVDADESLIGHATEVAVAADVPPGRAAVYLQDTQRRPLRVIDSTDQPRSRLALAVGGEGRNETLAYEVPNEDGLEDKSMLRVTTVYRGHARRGDFFVQPASGLDVVFQRPVYPPPEVTVHGQAQQRRTVVFVLDCSGTMGFRLGGDENNPRRIDEAIKALKAILEQLVGPREPYHVGVVAYGHRAYWERGNPNPINRPPNKGIHPSEDVEWLLKPGQFSDALRRRVNARLDDLMPLGETPLFYAITRAIGDYRTGDQRHVVVITDGFNDQSGGGPEGVVKSAATVKKLIDAEGNEDLRLDILGFELQAKTQTQEVSKNNLTNLADKAGGAFHFAQDTTSLQEALEKSLRLSRYTVRSAVDDRLQGKPVLLGTTVAIDQAADRRIPYVLALEDADYPAEARVELEWGDAPELYLTDDGRGLEHRRYDSYEKGLRDHRDDVADPSSPRRRFYIGGHLPERLGSTVWFYVSIQNGDEALFSPRPAEAWLRVVPLTGGRAANDGDGAEVYSFYDLCFNHNPRGPVPLPVPVLGCRAMNWPQGAEKAQIQLWCKLKKTTPSAEITVDRLQREGPVSLETLPGVTFELETKRGGADDPFEVTVIERHEPAADLYSVKVEMAVPPEAIRHRYNAKTHTVRHTFFYPDAVAGQVSEYAVRLTTHRRLTEGAVTLAKPLVVTVPSN